MPSSTFRIPTLRLTALAAACALLAACGGGGDDPVVVTPEPERPQDTRPFFVDEPSLPFTALAGAPDADRWWGTLDDSGYRIEVPKNWNGMLFLYAHGYAGTGPELRVSNPPSRRFLLEQGYAWAASSYSANYYDVRAGVEDTNALALAFNRLAEKHGRPLARPTKTYITGNSLGGHVTAAAIDAEAARTAVNRVSYDGAVPLCGVLGDTELYNYFAAYQVAAQQLANQPVGQWPVSNWEQIAPTVRSALFTQFPSQVTQPQGETLKTIVQNLTGGARPMFDQGFAGTNLQSLVWGTFGRDGTVQGILTEEVVDTRNIVYQLDDDPAISAEERAFNAQVFRVTPDADANRLRRDGLRWVPQANAEIDIPVVTLHTLGDMYVPFSMEQIYRERAIDKGTDQWLVQRAIRSTGHCDFTVAEQASALEAMLRWEQNGVKPEGDEVLDPAVVAAPDYGCRFTDNQIGVDDSPALGVLRASLPACPTN